MFQSAFAAVPGNFGVSGHLLNVRNSVRAREGPAEASLLCPLPAPLGFQVLRLDSLKSLILDSLTNLHQKGLLMLIRALRGDFCHLVLVVVWSLFCCWF